MLTVDKVTKKYQKFTALEDINLEFESGVYALLAPNGAGKTTLLKLITTLLFPTAGSIRLDGADILSLGDAYRDRLGYLPQEFGYYKNYSPRQYLHYIAALKGMTKRRAAERIDELLSLVRLTGVTDKKMRKFSGGMNQRVGIAQAMLNDPDILILDEPTAGLDPKERVHFRNVISSLSKEKTVILSTHIVSDVESIADHVIFLKDKRVKFNDTPQNICASLEGRVFERSGALSELRKIEERAFVLSLRQESDGATVRYVSDMGEPMGGTPARAGLEDVFLYTYRDDLAEDA